MSDIISALNSCTVVVDRRGFGILKWTKNELKELNKKTGKPPAMYGTHRPRTGIHRLYTKRASGGM